MIYRFAPESIQTFLLIAERFSPGVMFIKVNYDMSEPSIFTAIRTLADFIARRNDVPAVIGVSLLLHTQNARWFVEAPVQKDDFHEYLGNLENLGVEIFFTDFQFSSNDEVTVKPHRELK